MYSSTLKTGCLNLRVILWCHNYQRLDSSGWAADFLRSICHSSLFLACLLHFLLLFRCLDPHHPAISNHFLSLQVVTLLWGTLWGTWLRHCAASRMVAGSVASGVIGIFHLYNRTVALGSTESLTETSEKGKTVPLQTWSGPEGSRKLRFPDFMTTAQNGGKVVSLTHWPRLPPGNTRGTHFC